MITSQETEICLPLIDEIIFLDKSLIQVTYQKNCDMCFTNDKTIKIVSFSKKPEKIMSIDSFI